MSDSTCTGCGRLFHINDIKKRDQSHNKNNKCSKTNNVEINLPERNFSYHGLSP